MGLDISAYSKTRKALDGEVETDEDGDPKDWNSWRRISEGLVEMSNEHGQGQAADVEPGFYSFGEGFGFRAGSYSGYNSWRDELARMAGWTGAKEVWTLGQEEDAGGPFFEIINFSDCEGVIGPKISAKLSADFKANTDKAYAWAQEHSEDTGWFLEKYNDWSKAFELAADGGMVLFH